MVLNILDKKIRKAFSDAAIQYDVLTSMHREIGVDLVGKISHLEDCQNILDVGMGTGKLTKRLTFYFPDAQVIGVDFATGMIEKAKQQAETYKVVGADALALPFTKDSFDLIVSNLAYQWIEDLQKAFCVCYEKLKTNGQICFTIFGQNTLKELFSSFEQTANGKEIFTRKLPSIDSIRESLISSGFDDIDLDYERIKVHFPDMLSLLKWLKNIGANNLKNGSFIGKELLKQTSDYYDQHFKDRLGIYATFEVIWVEGKK